MIPLPNQEMFEQLLKATSPIKGTIIIYFTAKWCGACKNLNLDLIMKTFDIDRCTWYKCDVDENHYTPGYCNVVSMPSFVLIKNNKYIGMLAESNTNRVIEWLKRNG